MIKKVTQRAFRIRPLVFAIIAVSSAYSNIGNTQELIINEQIYWEKSPVKELFFNNTEKKTVDTIYLLSFKNAIYPDTETKIPYYSKRLKIDKNAIIDSISIIDSFYEIVPWVELSKIKNLNNIGQKITIEHNTLVDRGVPYLHVKFIPLKKNPETGYIEKLTSFKLKVSTSENKLNPKHNELKSYKNNSVLANGEWYKFKIKKDGIYKITYKNLKDLGITDFENIKLFGNGEGQLPYNNNEPRIDDLEEIPVFQSFGSDGKFNSDSDYILFFANGPHKWVFSKNDVAWRQYVHKYSNYAYYFIGSGIGKAKTIQNSVAISAEADYIINDYLNFVSHESERKNLFKSGRLWLGEQFKYSITEFDTTIVFNNIITDRPVRLHSQVVSRSDASTSFSFYQNSEFLGDADFLPVNLNSNESYYARSTLFKSIYNPSGEVQNIKLKYNKNGNCEGWLDYVSLNAYCQIRTVNDYLDFRNIQGIGDSSVHKFNITNTNSAMNVWDITDIHSTSIPQSTQAGDVMSFKSYGNTIRRFVVFNPNNNFPSPEFEEEKIENQNLHGTEAVDYVIIAPPIFSEQAKELADFHREKSGYKVLVTTPGKVYNEFSSGAPDVSAIRDFMRFLYKKYGTQNKHSIKHLLLFGDGTYDNRDNSSNNPGLILTYQSANSIHQTSSYVGDDYFTFLDDNEGDVGGSMDIGVGRFPVRTVDKAQDMVNKIIAYNTVETFRPWRNRVCFIGDDEDGNLHMDQANQLATKVNDLYPDFATQKIFLDAYKQVTSADGTRYPDVTKSIYDAIESGVLIMNYIGHGSEYGLAHERILENQDILNWQNAPFYPLFMTATCEFSRFDDLTTSAGENVLLNPNGGAIALLTTTRVVYAQQNFQLSKKFYDYAFQKNSEGERIRFGDILRLSKNAVSDDNKRNFTLLGDPACQLNFPLYQIYTDTINNVSAESFTDTISAFSTIKVKGHIGDDEGNIMDGFDGTIYPSVFDKEQTITTLNNDGKGTFTFNNRPAPIFQGKASVENGRFNFTFVLPKDIAYNIGTGKILYYADNDSLDAHGYFDKFYIGGKVDQVIVDNEGPEISLFLNDTNFISGGISGNAPSIYAVLSDQSGINTSSMGIGHDITIEIDNDKNKFFVINDYFETFQDDYTSGSVRYPLGNLEPGIHTAVLKAWDINNNSSTASITFNVKDPNKFVVENLINYPNPFSGGTNFTFEHNLINAELEIDLTIYSLTGELIHQIKKTIYTDGYKTPPIYWNGATQNGQPTGRGMYIYKLKVKTPEGATSENYNRLIIL